MSLLTRFVRRLRGAPPPEVPAFGNDAPLGQSPAPAASRQPVAAPAAPAAIVPKPFKRYPNLPGSDQQALARFGEAVCRRLDETPGATKLQATNLDIYTFRDFLSVEECSALVELIDADAQPSSILSTSGNTGKRTSHTCKLPGEHPLVAEVERRMADLLGLPLANSETLQGQRYSPGQQFKLHNDYFAGGQAYSEAVASEGGQRTWTAMVFLNRPEIGGCTNFPRAGVKVAPEAGTLLAWNNNDGEGLSNPYTHHEGMLVEAGVKYILTKWFREREWRSSAVSDALRF